MELADLSFQAIALDPLCSYVPTCAVELLLSHDVAAMCGCGGFLNAGRVRS